MPFERGNLTFSMFELRGELPENALELFASRHGGALDQVGPEPETGWVAGSDLLDNNLDESSVMAGHCLWLNLRSAVRKVPSGLLNALCRRRELLFMQESGRDIVPSAKRREIKEEVFESQIGSMPVSFSPVPVVIDPRAGVMYAGCASRAKIELLIKCFYETVKFEPVQISPELLLERDFQLTEATFPQLKTAEGEAAGNVGRDFLMWLWFFSENGGRIELPGIGDFEFFLEGPLLFAAPDDAPGSSETSVRKGGSPLRSAEAKAALDVGKKLRKAKLTVADNLTRRVWSTTFDADNFAFGSMKLPEGEMQLPLEVLLERVEFLNIFRAVIEGCFKKFAATMLGADRAGFEADLAEWARGRDAI